MWQTIDKAPKTTNKNIVDRYIVGIVKTKDNFILSTHICFYDGLHDCWWDDLADEMCKPTHFIECPNPFK